MKLKLILALILLLTIGAFTQILGPIMMTSPAAGAPNFPEKTPSYNYSCSAGTTCAITLSQAIATGDLVTVEVYVTNQVWPISLSAGGTLIPCFSCSNGSGTIGRLGAGYVLSASYTSGPVTVTLNSASGGSGFVAVLRDFTIAGGSVTVDSVNSIVATTGSGSYAGVATGTLTGTNDAIVQSTATDYAAVTACASPWNTNALFDSGSGGAWCDHVNTTSTTPPTYTATGSGNAVKQSMAFGFGATACGEGALMDASGGSNGTVFTTTTLANSTFGLPNGSWTLSTTPLSALTATTISALNFHTSKRLCSGGGTYTGTSTLAYTYTLSVTPEMYARYTLVSGGHQTSAGLFWRTSLGSDVVPYDTFAFGAVAKNFVSLQHTNAGLNLECVGGSTNYSSTINISSNTDYWVTVRLDDTTGAQMTVYETSGWTSLGTASCTASGWTVAPVDTLEIGQGGSSTTHPAATITYKNVILNLNGTYPVVP